MTKIEVKKLFFIISTVHRNFVSTKNAQEQEMQVAVWHNLIERFEYSLAEQAVYDNLRNSKFEPTPADIVSSINKIQRALFPSADEQWRQYEHFLQVEYKVQSWEPGYDPQAGYNLKRNAWDKLPRPIRDYFGGDMREALKWKKSTQKEMQIERNRFFKIYDNLLERYEVLTHVPKAVVQQIATERKSQSLQLSASKVYDEDGEYVEEWWQK